MPIAAEQTDQVGQFLVQGVARLGGEPRQLSVCLRRDRLQAGRAERAGRPPARPDAVQGRDRHVLRSGLEGELRRSPDPHHAQRLLQQLQGFPGHHRQPDVAGVRDSRSTCPARPRSTASKPRPRRKFGGFGFDVGAERARTAASASSSPLDPARHAQLDAVPASEHRPGNRAVPQPEGPATRPTRRGSPSTRRARTSSRWAATRR